MPIWVVVVLVLVGLLVVADRVAVAVAESAAATTLQRSQNLPQRPSVSIGGFPFLTQLATGDYSSVTVRATDVPIRSGSTQLTITRLDVQLRDVHVNRSFTEARSTSSSATALITYADLSSLLHAKVAYAGGGRVRAAGSVDVAGVAVDGSATAGVAVAGQTLHFTDVRVDVGGVTVPDALTNYLDQLLAAPVPLSGLPFGVRVTGVAAGASGVTIALTAPGLTFHR